VVEVFRKRLVVAEAEVAERALLSVTLGRDLRLADLTSRRALAFGVTASLGADASPPRRRRPSDTGSFRRLERLR
jgi:hypothetical protein